MGRTLINGGVYWIDLDKDIISFSEHIQRGKRPVIIFMSNDALRFSPMIDVLPITSKVKKKLLTHVQVSSECGLKQQSTVLCEQIITVPKHNRRR